MGEKHWIKTVTHSRRISTEIEKQSKHDYWTNYQEGRKGDIFAAIPRKINTGLPALIV